MTQQVRISKVDCSSTCVDQIPYVVGIAQKRTTADRAGGA